MVKKQKDDLMLTKEQLMKAVEQEKIIKEKYNEFWLYNQMLLEINNELLKGQFELVETDKNA